MPVAKNVGPKLMRRDSGGKADRPHAASRNAVAALPPAYARVLDPKQAGGLRNAAQRGDNLGCLFGRGDGGRLHVADSVATGYAIAQACYVAGSDTSRLQSVQAAPVTDGGTEMQKSEEFGARIKALRLARHEDQIDVAVSVGVSRPTIAEWESGKKSPRRERLQAVAQHFNVTTDFLLFGDVGAGKVRPEGKDEERLILLSRRVHENVKSAVMTILENAAEADPVDRG